MLSREFVGLELAAMEPREAYALLLHCVAPRPIAVTSTLSPDGIPNLAPFSFFMAGGANPPSVVISPTTPRNGGEKDTLRNIRETGEYVINVATREIAERVNQASAEYPSDESEWGHAGLTPVPSHRVKPARVGESPLAMECRLFCIVRHGDGPMSANYVIGEVLYVHIASGLLDDGAVDATQIGYIARMGGDWYAHVRPDGMFEMPRPPRVPEADKPGH